MPSKESDVDMTGTTRVAKDVNMRTKANESGMPVMSVVVFKIPTDAQIKWQRAIEWQKAIEW